MKISERLHTGLGSLVFENPAPTQAMRSQNGGTFTTSFLLRAYATMLHPQDRFSVCACLIQSIKHAQGSDSGCLWTIWWREFRRPGYGSLWPFYASTAAEKVYDSDATSSI